MKFLIFRNYLFWKIYFSRYCRSLSINSRDQLSRFYHDKQVCQGFPIISRLNCIPSRNNWPSRYFATIVHIRDPYHRSMPKLDLGSPWHRHEFYEGNGGFRLIGWGSNERGSNPHPPSRGGHEMVLKRGQGLKSPRIEWMPWWTWPTEQFHPIIMIPA